MFRNCRASAVTIIRPPTSSSASKAHGQGPYHAFAGCNGGIQIAGVWPYHVGVCIIHHDQVIAVR